MLRRAAPNPERCEDPTMKPRSALASAVVLHEALRKVKGSDFEVVQPPPGYRPPPEK
jgi:hypothetical protein